MSEHECPVCLTTFTGPEDARECIFCLSGPAPAEPPPDELSTLRAQLAAAEETTRVARESADNATWALNHQRTQTRSLEERLHAAEARAQEAEAESLALYSALRDLEGCIVWSDTTQGWHCAGRERTYPALTRAREALDSAKAGRAMLEEVQRLRALAEQRGDALEAAADALDCDMGGMSVPEAVRALREQLREALEALRGLLRPKPGASSMEAAANLLRAENTLAKLEGSNG